MMDEWLSLPAAYPEARRAIEALDPIVREELDRGLEPLNLHAGGTLFTCGDPRDAVFLIMGGHIVLTGQGSQDSVLSAGEGVGAIGLSADGPHTTTARALDEARVYRLGRIAFERVCEKFPEDISRLAEFITPVAHETLLARVMCDLFGEQDVAQLTALLAEVECLQLKRGDVLHRLGEDADSMFVVIYGRLRMHTREDDGTETIVDELGRGDTLGQISLFVGDAQAITVNAVCDSAVGVITRPVFEHLKLMYPDATARLARIALRRVQRCAASPDAFHAADTVSLAVLAVGGPRGRVQLTAFTERLASVLSGSAATLHLSSERLDGLLSTPGIAHVDPAHPSESVLAGWLQRQALCNRYVIYQADDTWSPWTERCLRMADRVLLVGHGAYAPAPTEMDEPLARVSDSTATELVLIQPDGISRPSGTAAWLNRYAAAGHHHVRLGRTGDFNSFVRRVTGRGLGLVLGGGAARGFAHIGVLRALAECGVDVDLVGGTSMGAVLGATFAMGMDYEDTMRLARQLASPFRLFDPTIPVVSFFASEKVTQMLERIYGDMQIEDLWMPCFCVSSSLTHAVAVVHRRGRLWQAVRASMAIPGVFSPILAEGDILVDGCVLNNLPIDVMQRLNHDGPIIAVNVFPDVDLLRDYHFGPSISGWHALVAKLNPLRRWDRSAPLIFESLVRVLALNDVKRAKIKSRFADVYIRPPVEDYNILDFGAYARIADIGYRSAVEALREWEGRPGRDGAPAAPDPVPAITSPPARDSITAPLHKTLAELDDLLGCMD